MPNPRTRTPKSKSPRPRLRGVTTCVFDAYGTLFDFAAAAAHFRRHLGAKTEPLTEIWRQKQLQYTWLRSLMGRHIDFWHVTQDALDFAFDALKLKNESLKAGLLDVYTRLDAFPEVKTVLTKLKAAGFQTAILSNGSPMMLRAAAGSAGIESLIDDVISVEEVAIYKPHPSVYQLVLSRFSVEPREVVYLSSNGWDAYAAKAFGFRAIWVNRTRAPAERVPQAPDLVVRSLRDLPPLVGSHA